jgi:hypothetical protein
MKKTLLTAIPVLMVLWAAILNFSGCKNNAPQEPQLTATPTCSSTASPTVTVTPTLYVRIEVSSVRDITGDYVLAHINRNNSPCPDATVIVSGSYVPHVTSSLYRLNATVPYVYGQPYSVTVTVEGVNFTEISPGAPGDAAITTDGLSATWAYDGSNDYIYIYDDSNDVTYSDGPDITPSYTISSDAYLTPGTYHIYLFMMNRQFSNFARPDNADPASFTRIYELKLQDVVK